jgi:hypothetical protein
MVEGMQAIGVMIAVSFIGTVLVMLIFGNKD